MISFGCVVFDANREVELEPQSEKHCDENDENRDEEDGIRLLFDWLLFCGSCHTTLLIALQHHLHRQSGVIALHLLHLPTHLLSFPLPALALHAHTLLTPLLARTVVTHLLAHMTTVRQRLLTPLPARKQPPLLATLRTPRRLPAIAASLHDLLARRTVACVTVHQRTRVVACMSSRTQLTTHFTWSGRCVTRQRAVLFFRPPCASTYVLPTRQQLPAHFVAKRRLLAITAQNRDLFVSSLALLFHLLVTRRTRLAVVTHSLARMAARELLKAGKRARRAESGMAGMGLNSGMMTGTRLFAQIGTLRVEGSPVRFARDVLHRPAAVTHHLDGHRACRTITLVTR